MPQPDCSLGLPGDVAGNTIQRHRSSRRQWQPGADSTKTFTVTVGNTAPVLAAIDDQTAYNGQQLSVQLAATDSDAPPQSLTYGLVNGPTGASVSSAGLFTWRPSGVALGTQFTVTVEATDNGSPTLNATRSFVVTVTNGTVYWVGGISANWDTTTMNWSSTDGGPADSYYVDGDAVVFDDTASQFNVSLSPAFPGGRRFWKHIRPRVCDHRRQPDRCNRWRGRVDRRGRRECHTRRS